jgi:hypothetical protein
MGLKEGLVVGVSRAVLSFTQPISVGKGLPRT